MRLLQKAIFALGVAAFLLCIAVSGLIWPRAAGAAALLLHDPAAVRQIYAESAENAAVWRPQNGSGTRPTKIPAPTAAPQPTATPTASPEPSATPSPTPATTAPPALKDAEETGIVTPQQFPQGSGTGYITLPAGTIKNSTELPDSTLAAATQGALPFAVALGSDEPQVLILHTHATESYQQWEELLCDRTYSARTKDKTQNMCAVGAHMAEVLNAAGVNTLHDETLHDDPSYTESYARSAETARQYLQKYPSIKVVLDVHRDAIEADGARIKPLCTVEGQNTAQIMIIAGCDNGSTVKLPNWQLNLRFAAAWESQMEARCPGLTRPVLCGYRYYNQDVCTGALLVEIGGHGNTLDEALRAGTYAATALAALFGAQTGA